MKFVLEIELDNDAMQSCGHVAHALVEVAKKLNEFPVTRLMIEEGFKIRDENGNTVGKWEVSV